MHRLCHACEFSRASVASVTRKRLGSVSISCIPAKVPEIKRCWAQLAYFLQRR